MATDSSDHINFNPTTTTEKTLNKPQMMTLLLLLSRPLDRLEEEEEKEPTDEASDQPSVTTVNSDAKYGEDLKSTVATACSRGCC